MNHTCLCLPSWSWYSFTDPGGMEGWVGLAPKLKIFFTQNTKYVLFNFVFRLPVFGNVEIQIYCSHRPQSGLRMTTIKPYCSGSRLKDKKQTKQYNAYLQLFSRVILWCQLRLPKLIRWCTTDFDVKFKNFKGNSPYPHSEIKLSHIHLSRRLPN